jgi:hypothetical protein
MKRLPRRISRPVVAGLISYHPRPRVYPHPLLLVCQLLDSLRVDDATGPDVLMRCGSLVGRPPRSRTPDPEVCHNRPAGDGEWGVLKLGAVSFGVFDENENKALPAHLKPRPYLEVAPGQILISRANITRLVGATALIEKTRSKLMLCHKTFRVVQLDSTRIDAAFRTEVFRIADVRRHIESNVTGTSPTMKNISQPALLRRLIRRATRVSRASLVDPSRPPPASG